MKLLYTTDLHGHKEKYDRLLTAAEAEKPGAVIIGGDILPFPEQGRTLKQVNFIEDYLDGFFKRLNDQGIYCLLFLGNDDYAMWDGDFQEVCDRYPRVFNLAQKKYELNGYEFIGMNYVCDYPFHLKDRCRLDTADGHAKTTTGILSVPDGLHNVPNWAEYIATLPTIEEELERLTKPKNMSKTVYVMHMPPAGLLLDKTGGYEYVGSHAIYEFIKKNQPRLTLHGHIHEGPMMTGTWKIQFGRTWCIQPGQEGYSLIFVTIDLKTMVCNLKGM
jgi:Icc-related predicted phosphoesterase